MNLTLSRSLNASEMSTSSEVSVKSIESQRGYQTKTNKENIRKFCKKI